MDMKAVLADPRRRNLAVLAGAALVALLLALGALPRYPPLGFGTSSSD